MLKEATGLGKEDIFKVETKDSFSFFSTEAEHTNRVLESLKGANLEGREVRVELSGDSQGKGGGNPRKKSFKSGNFKKSKGPWDPSKKSKGSWESSKKRDKGGKKSKKRNGFQ
jgi:ATP-dependent RNA helicase DeaD